MTCQECKTAFAQRYTYNVASVTHIAWLCPECADTFSGWFLLRRERRADINRADRNKPEWLKRLTAKDMTGSIA